MAAINIVILDALTMGAGKQLERFKDFGSVQIYDITLPDERLGRIRGADIVITNKVIIDRAIMEQCPSLKLICISATGLNNVDLEAAREKQIEVRNVAGYSTQSVCQSVFSMLLYLLHQTNYYDSYVKSGNYAASPIFTHHGPEFWELHGKQLGIIGLGTIGKRVAHVAAAFGMKVVYYSTTGKNSNADFERVELDALLAESDVISIHCPLNEQTEGLIGDAQIHKMKPSAFLINTGRGKIVHEAALAKALDENKIAGAALDVLEKEPINADNPLLRVRSASKILITPHTAWTSREAKQILMQGVYDNIKAWLDKN